MVTIVISLTLGSGAKRALISLSDKSDLALLGTLEVGYRA